jgi:hypothetical protein
MNEHEILELEKELKFGDLIRISWKNEVITGYFDKIEIHYNRSKFKYAFITIVAKVPRYQSISKDFKREKEGRYLYGLEEIDSVEFLNRILSEENYFWEEVLQ